MITKMERIPVTGTSHPFQYAAKRCRFDEIEYAEDEYFMSGTADIYTECSRSTHEVKSIFHDAPYTTRLLVRRPLDPTSFSGNVVLEILNATAHMDIDRIWVNTWKYFTDHGDIYIGITSKGDVVDALKRFDPERYASISWDNPLPERTVTQPEGGMPILTQYELGLYWDMQNDLAHLLRTDSPLNPIRDYGKVKCLILAGWSQSGGYIVRTVRSFAEKERKKYGTPLFDGYFEAGADSGIAPVNTFEPESGGRILLENSVRPSRGVVMSSEPYIALNTESENRGAAWSEDRDLPGWKFRSYEIAGTSHDERYNMLTYYEGEPGDDAERANFRLGFSGCEGEPLDTPYEYVFAAAFRNLYAWVREGIPAPHAPRIDLVRAGEKDHDFFCERSGKGKSFYENRKDAFGNSTGGIRLADLDFPTGRIQSFSRREDDSVDPMFGTVFPFSAGFLKELYGSLSHYRELVSAQADRIIAEGFLLPDDREAYIDEITDQAGRRGLV